MKIPPRSPLDDIDHAFQRPVMMGAGLRVRVDVHRAGPELLGPDTGEIDRCLAIHAGRLRGVRIKLVAADDAHAVVLPRRVVIGVVLMFFTHSCRLVYISGTVIRKAVVVCDSRSTPAVLATGV